MVANSVRTSLILVVLVIGLATASSLLNSDIQLKLKGSYSSISQSKYQQYPDIYSAQSSNVQGSFSATLFETSTTKLLFAGYEGFYAPYPDVYPSAVFYNVEGGNVVEVSRLSVPAGAGQTNAFVSTTPGNRYVAITRYIPIGFVSPYASHNFILYIHNYSDAGVIDPVPTLVYNLANLAPANFYNKSVSYTGLSGISVKGDVLQVTYAVGLPYLGAITGQKHALLKVSSDHASVTLSVAVDTLPTGFPSLYSFPQKTVLFQTCYDNNKYHFVSADNSWNITSPLGFTASVSSYIFDSVANTLVLADSSAVAQYIQGFSVDRKNNIVYAITNEVSSDGVSVLQFPRVPYVNNASDKDTELHAWKLNNNGKLDYQGGLELASDGIQVEPSPNGKYLAVSYAGIIGNEVQYTSFTGLGNISRVFSPNTVNLYKVKVSPHGVSLNLLDTSSASPLSFGLAFDAKSKALAVVGQSTYRVLPGGYRVGQKDTQLYEISDDDE